MEAANDIPSGQSSEGNDARLSDLPEPIIHHIFSFLDAIDVVRTSALSSQWRYRWVSLPCLNFDISIFSGKPYEEVSLTVSQRFKDFVNWFLLLQNGSCDIWRFYLSCLNFPDDRYMIQRWMHIVALQNVRELCLQIHSGERFELPNCLLASESLSLFELELNGCWLELPVFTGCSRLKSIKLVAFTLSDGSTFHNFISRCLLLENLQMEESDFRGFKNLVVSASELRNLNIDVWEESEDIQDTLLKISCPNLISLSYSGPMPKDLCLDKLPLLKNAFIHLDVNTLMKEEHDLLILEIIRAISRVVTLKFSEPFAMLFYRVIDLGEHPPSLDNLKSLKVSMPFEKCSMECLVTLLKFCPNLETLTVLLDYLDAREESNLWIAPVEGFACLSHSFRMIEFINFEAMENELKLLTFLLKYGEVLKRVRISYSQALNTPTKVIETIKEFPRSSSSVTFKFTQLVSKLYTFDV